MFLNIFKTLLYAFLIFLSCFVADLRGKSISELEEINKAEFDSSELNSKITEGSAGERSVAVNSADYNCDRGKCRNKKSCNCCPGWGLSRGGLFESESCKECKCGKQFNCTFGFSERKTCLCGTGYSEVNRTCKADCKKNPCKNRGTCVVNGNDVLCKCTQLYGGEFCEKNMCSLLQCQENERCVVENGYSRCKILDLCEPNPCKNGGSCIIISDLSEGFSCDCPVGFTGETCETDVCSLLQCHENEICVVENGDVSCVLQDFCSEVCGEKPGVVCNGDKTKIDAIKCSCKDKDKMFDQEEKECKVKKDFCSEVCGEKPGVVCSGDKTKSDAIKCSCKDKDKMFDQEEKECKVKEDYCSEVCGEKPGVVCNGDQTKSDAIKCSCKDKDKLFDQEEKECKIKEVDFCLEVCGEKPGVVCNGDKTRSDAITCFCKDKDKMFDQVEKECKVKEVDFCSEVCGEKPEVMCNGDKTEKDAIICFCKDKDKIFDKEEKECKVKEVDFCLEVCGEKPEVVCNGDKTKKDAIICSCKDKDKMFDQEQKECKVKRDLCSEVCGENPEVMCEGDKTKRDTISCSCKDKDKMFDEEEKKCKVRKDRNACSFNYWQVSWEAAAKQCIDEGSNLLCYNSRKEMDDILNAFRLTAMDNAKLTVWMGNRNCTNEKKKMEKCLSLHIEKIDNRVWHYFQTNCNKVYPFVCCANGNNKCDGLQCQNGGICKIIDGKAVCVCPGGYTGDVCEKHPCTNHSCQNGGRCIFDGENSKCICKKPFTGKFCERDPCSNEPCLNGGQCFVTGTSFNCNCKQPYSGKFCETNLCAQYICKNGGICRGSQGEAKCFCKEPYGGKFCDIRMDACATNVCKNGGICRTVNDEPKCFCVEPYEGRFCDTRTDLRYQSVILALMYVLLGLIILISVGVLISCLFSRRICLGRK